MVSVLSCTEDGQTAGSSKESGTTSCFPEKEEQTGTSIYQKDHWTDIPGSDPAILYLYVLDFF